MDLRPVRVSVKIPLLRLRKPDAPLGKKLVSEKEKQTIFPTKIESVKQQEKPARKPVKYAEMYISQKPRGNQRNWNKRSLQLPSKGRDVNTAKEKVYTVKPKAVNTARPTSAVVNAVRANQVNAVKASACWVWRPTKLNSNMSYLSDFKEFDEGYVTFGGGARGGRITGKGTLKTGKHHKGLLCDNGTEFKNIVMNELCEKKVIKRDFSVARTPQQNGVAERRNRTLIEAARTMLADFKLPTTFWAEAVNTACYVQNRVIIVKPHNKTPYELFRESSLTSKAFRVYNIRTRKVEENLHIRFLENKPIVTGDGPKWLFDIDSLTKSMNYVPVVAGTNSNDFAGSEESNGAGHTSKETEFSQDYIVMPLNAEKKDDEGVSKASGFSDQEQPESSTPNINTDGPSINTASANFKTGSLNINTVSPTVITTRSNRSQNVSDMFSLGRSATLEATHADLFGDETEMDMSNLTTSYQVLTTPNTRIHKDHSLNHVIGDI
ncbi:putative ribonuclease H-like domain-containing protein [Tanacetum coccineum]